MPSESDSSDHHRQRSEFIRNLVQKTQKAQSTRDDAHGIPKTIMQFWHDISELPEDVAECISSWSKWESRGFVHRLFDRQSAEDFISHTLGHEHVLAFGRCYHPAMQADYFRLCYIFVEGGLYVDADDVCIASDISFLFRGPQLKVQPLCYDIDLDTMIEPADFLKKSSQPKNWIFYVNNNPLVGRKGDPIVERSLMRSTRRLNEARRGELLEIQSATGPGNLSRTIFEMGKVSDIEGDLLILKDWEATAISKWPLSYRGDARNWRHSNQRSFDVSEESAK
ncbi:hypothetical protein BWR19_15320 [Halomonas sp. 1513]|nr:hypothetical protein BWR19_15320 [Halomonas sp. 1513]